jgi:hypothetical protein
MGRKIDSAVPGQGAGAAKCLMDPIKGLRRVKTFAKACGGNVAAENVRPVGIPSQNLTLLLLENKMSFQIAKHDDGLPILTSYQSRNDFLMAQVAKLYFRPGDRIADVTFGKGRFWRQIDLTKYDFHASDLLTVPDHPYDFRHLPYRSETLDVHVFDPPYMRNPPARRYMDADYKNFETTKGFSHDDIIQLYRDGMAEGHRVLKRSGLMLVKCKDEMEGGRQRMSHIEIYDIAVKDMNMEVKELFVLTPKSLQIRFRHENRARKNHSYLWVFQKG